MKKISRFPLLAAMLACTAALTACHDDDDEQPRLVFEVVSNSNPAHIRVEYGSPDPHCLPPSHYIYAGTEGGDVVLRCTNRETIQTQTSWGYPPYEYGDTFTWTSGGITATVTDGNLVTIHLDKVEPIQGQYPADYLKSYNLNFRSEGQDPAIYNICVMRDFNDRDTTRRQ